MTDTPSLLSEPPQAALGLLGDRLPLLQEYAGRLAGDGVVRGLIGPREAPRLWDRHLLNCAILSDLLPGGATVADVGSGAGLPGLVLAIARPDLHLTLIEPLLRRTTFLAEMAEALDLRNAEVVRGRAEVLHGRRQFDVVTSRALAPLDRLLEWSMPLVAAGGVLVAMKGSSVADEVEVARSTLARLGCAEPEVVILGAGTLSSTTVALRVAWADPSAVSLPSAGSAVERHSSRKRGGSGGGKRRAQEERGRQS